MFMIFEMDRIDYLVRFGGAGAVLPFLFVVRRICTLTLLPPAENVDNLDDVDPGSDEYKSKNNVIHGRLE